MISPMLAPVVTLCAWSMVMLVWLVAAGGPAMKFLDPAVASQPGFGPTYVEHLLPAWANWPRHNYNHLMEQPTVFYAVALSLAAFGAGGADVALAWSYVGLRVVHSLVQATFNRVSVRAPIWSLATLVLIALTIRAGIAVFA